MASHGLTDRVAIVAGDITEPQTADKIVTEAVNRFGRVDVLVNNAGIFDMKPFTDYSVEELDAFLGYLRGTFVTSQAAVRQMRKQGDGGAIINISTILALNGVNGLPSSAPIAAKGGITALTKNLSVELAADNIRNQARIGRQIWNTRAAMERGILFPGIGNKMLAGWGSGRQKNLRMGQGERRLRVVGTRKFKWVI